MLELMSQGREDHDSWIWFDKSLALWLDYVMRDGSRLEYTSQQSKCNPNLAPLSLDFTGGFKNNSIAFQALQKPSSWTWQVSLYRQ